MRQIIRRTVLILLLLAMGSGVLASKIALIVAEGGELPSYDGEVYGGELCIETADLWRRFFDGAPAAELLPKLEEPGFPGDTGTAARLELYALLHQGQGDYEKAFSAFSGLINEEPTRPENLLWLERMALMAGEFADGHRYLRMRCGDYVTDSEQNAELRFAAHRMLIDLARQNNDPVRANELAHSNGFLSRYSYL
ncbi:hypothetical protein K8R78_04270, partial [bacterium]|nr:hypothetical protein [bacterium]